MTNTAHSLNQLPLRHIRGILHADYQDLATIDTIVMTITRFSRGNPFFSNIFRKKVATTP